MYNIYTRLREESDFMEENTKNLEQMWDEEWDREMQEFREEAYRDFDDDWAAGYEEFEPGRGYWDEMAANP